MSNEPFARLRRFLHELKRRNVYKVAVAYIAVAFVVLQGARLLVPALVLPEWFYRVVVALALLGFPLALVLAWAFEMTPEGVRRTEALEEERVEAPSRRQKSRFAVKVLVGLGLLAAAVAGGWYLTGGGGEPEVTARSIAVLPFENMGGEGSAQFTQGVHDGLLTRLSNVSDLQVISRTSVLQYEDTEKTVPQIARELEAQWVVEGAVQQAGGQVQVNAQLIKAPEDAHQWAQSYRQELNPENLFAIQSELTKQIARSLQTQLSPEETERVERQPTEDLEAYQLYVQGRRQLSRRRFREGRQPGEAVQRAVRKFRRALARDSSFALAWSGLADAAALYPPNIPDSIVAPGVKQETAARRAVKLAPDLAEARATMGFVHREQMNAPAAVRELNRAVQLKPSYWEAHHWLGDLYFRIGHPGEALDHLKIAVELNPRHARARHLLYDAYLAVGQEEKSLKEVRRQQGMGLEGISAVGGEVRALYHLGRYDQAARLAREHLAQLEDGATWKEVLLSYLVTIRAAAGDTARAREFFARLKSHEIEFATQQVAEVAALGWAHAALGETDRALRAFGRLSEEAWGWLGISASLRYGIHLDLAPLRDDPRYQELIREANRAWGLNPDGSFPSEPHTESDE